MATGIELSSRKVIKASTHLLHSTNTSYVCWALEIRPAPCPVLSEISGRHRQQTTNKYIHGDECYREIIKRVKDDPKLCFIIIVLVLLLF